MIFAKGERLAVILPRCAANAGGLLCAAVMLMAVSTSSAHANPNRDPHRISPREWMELDRQRQLEMQRRENEERQRREQQNEQRRQSISGDEIFLFSNCRYETEIAFLLTPIGQQEKVECCWDWNLNTRFNPPSLDGYYKLRFTNNAPIRVAPGSRVGIHVTYKQGQNVARLEGPLRATFSTPQGQKTLGFMPIIGPGVKGNRRQGDTFEIPMRNGVIYVHIDRGVREVNIQVTCAFRW